MSLLLSVIVDASIVLALALAAAAMLRRQSAALRHGILAAAVIAAAAMPVFELALPQLPVVHWNTSGTALSSGLTLSSIPSTGGLTDDVIAAADDGVPWTAWFVALWVLGATVMAAALVTSLGRLSRLRARCTPVTGRAREMMDELARECGLRRRVALLQSPDPSLLVTCGVFEPVIILPTITSEWSDDRMRIVLRHELAHIGRHDAAIQLAGEALRILQWGNPLAWIACRRLRQESEYACDDEVLRDGVEGTEYATHLLDVARHLSAHHPAWTAAPAIAHPSTLERRIVVMLQRQRNRSPLTRRGWAITTLGAIALTLPLAAAGIARDETASTTSREARAVALPSLAPGANTSASPSGSATPTGRDAIVRQAPAAVSGRVLDQSGGAMPGVRLTLTDPRSGVQLVQQTNASGEFRFRDLPPGSYELVAAAPAFATISNVLTVTSGAVVQRTITLPLGTLQETITRGCSEAPIPRAARAIVASIFPVLAAQQPPSAPVRVGGNVSPPKKLTDVKPVCPAAVPAGETTVRLTARVGVDGFVHDVKLAPSDAGHEPPAELTQSAMDAVRQWTFTPTLLNGQRVAVMINVSITFTRS